MARSDRHGNREAKQPKKLKSKEMAPVFEARLRSTNFRSSMLSKSRWVSSCVRTYSQP
jgi:hypothetical protein